MIEPELAFADLNDDMACATAYLQYVVCYLTHLLSYEVFNKFIKFAYINFLHSWGCIL